VAAPKLIVALDYSSKAQALSLVSQLEPRWCALKVGLEMFTSFGPSFVRELAEKRFPIFLDLKFHDIPNTVAKACHAAAELGVWMLNVHASGGSRMLSAARKAVDEYGNQAPLLIAVTILTSLDEQQYQNLGYIQAMKDKVNQLAQLAMNEGLDGVVCSPHEVGEIKNTCKQGFLTVTPGIRLHSFNEDDQARTMTAAQAWQQGSDFLVVGRPITQASDPRDTVLQILNSLES
jgi:orotidine-5'-phosphate decarboxylase